MNKLSIYCDLRSIGWIITNGNNIIRKGIKRINVDFDTYYEFISGNVISKRVNRRLKRTARRNKWRRNSRKESLINFLTCLNMMPTKEMLSTDKLSRYKLRVKALSKIVSAKELGLIMFDLQKKRGYKSMRGVMADGSDYLDQIKEHEENLKSFPSISAYLLTIDSDKDVIFTRESYEAEFDKICQKQITDSKITEKLRSIIYFQRPLRKGAISNCNLEKNRKVTHKSHPDYQTFRCYRDANNITILDNQMKEVPISLEFRYKWANNLLKGNGLTKASCCKDLGIKKSTGYSWLSGKRLEPSSMCQLNEFDFNSFDLWHNLYSATDEAKLINLLIQKSGFTDEQIERLIDIDFKGMGWGEFSHKAINRLLPYLQKGMKLKEAILKEYGSVDMSSDITLRNLLLEQVFESTKSLIEEISKQYQIGEMQIELNQSLKQGNKIRKRISSGKRKKEKWEKENEQTIIDAGAEPSSYNYHKLKLWEEWDGYSPYDPDIKIDLKDLFTDEYNIDHIVPKCKIMERGFNNQCLSKKNLNEHKDQLTGIEFAEKTGIIEKYKSLIESLKISDTKRKFLFMKSNEIPTDYVSSMSGSDYNTKCFLTLHENSTCIPNKIVNRYYREWNFNQFNDEDARSSLMKALVLCNMSNETVKYFDNLVGLGEKSIGRYNLTPEITDIGEMPNIYMPSIKLYRKIKGNYSPRFQLHKETVYGYRPKKTINGKGQEIIENYYKVRKPIESLTKPMMSKIMDGAISKIVNERFNECGTIDKFIESIEENPLIHNGKQIKSISIEVKSDAVMPLHSTDGNGNTFGKKHHDKKIDFVYSSGAAFMYLEKGKYRTMPLMEYIDSLNNGTIHKFEKTFAKNDVVKFEGNHYFICGISDGIVEIRPTHQLNAEKGIKCSKNKISEFEKLIINQLGYVI